MFPAKVFDLYVSIYFKLKITATVAIITALTDTGPPESPQRTPPSQSSPEYYTQILFHRLYTKIVYAIIGQIMSNDNDVRGGTNSKRERCRKIIVYILLGETSGFFEF